MEIVLIVAVADNGVIGAGGAIPWRLRTDQQRFKAMTMGKPIVMGRKTFVSFPRRPLPGRTNIIVTRDPQFRAAGAVVTTSFAAARAVAHGDALRRSVADGDTRFPPIETAKWEEVARQRHPAGPGDSAEFSYVTYRRRRPH
jgi:dihydrofolate reductase